MEWATGENSKLSFQGAGRGRGVKIQRWILWTGAEDSRQGDRTRNGLVAARSGAGEGWHLSAGSGRRYVTERYAPRRRTQDCVGWSGPNVGV